MGILQEIKKELRRKSSREKAIASLRFFKTKKGEYGEGDKFLGPNMPEQRKIAKKFARLINFKDILKLLQSKFHEERMVALLILTIKYKKGSKAEQEQIYKAYLSNTKFINNWDLVDITCRDIAGAHLFLRNREILYKLAKSKNLWEKRIAIVSTFYFISKGELDDTFKISKMLLPDKHDLIHKAVGWALREAGKKNRLRLTKFLKENIRQMPRTTLRYAIEKFPERERKRFLKM